MTEISKKHKTFSYVKYIRGIELEVICVTTSKKRFAEILDAPIAHISSYATSYDLRYQICNENPNVLFAQPGMGGEGAAAFNKGEIKTLEEYKDLIDEHRKIYSNYRDYLNKTKKD